MTQLHLESVTFLISQEDVKLVFESVMCLTFDILCQF